MSDELIVAPFCNCAGPSGPKLETWFPESTVFKSKEKYRAADNYDNIVREEGNDEEAIDLRVGILLAVTIPEPDKRIRTIDSRS